MGRREAREVARLRVRMLEELGEMGGEDPRTLVGPPRPSCRGGSAPAGTSRAWLRRTDRAELYPHDLPFGGCRSTRSPNTIAKAT